MRLHDYEASANCYKVRLLLAQLGLEYERVPVDIFAGETLTAEFAAINPMRSTPVLEPEPGSYLPESGAILTYLAEGSELLPSAPLERAQVLRWLLLEQADIVPAIGGLRFRLLTGRLATDEPEARAAAWRARPCSRCSTRISRSARSSSASAIRSPTSPSSATRTPRTRRVSTRPPTRPSAPGCDVSNLSRAS